MIEARLGFCMAGPCGEYALNDTSQQILLLWLHVLQGRRQHYMYSHLSHPVLRLIKDLHSQMGSIQHAIHRASWQVLKYYDVAS